MPRTRVKLPRIGYEVKFRIIGSKQLHDGTYTKEGFEHCNGFICYTTCEVDYWNYHERTAGNNFDNTRDPDDKTTPLWEQT